MPPPAEELRRLYVAERWDPERIGDHYGRSPSTVGRWLKKFDIRRPRLSWALTISAERLRELYDTPLTMDEIAEHEGVTRGQVERAMHRHNIQARDPSSWSPPARERPPAAELRRVYNEKESVRGVAGHYDVGVRTAHEWLSDPEVGIQLQPPRRPRMPTPSASSSWNRM